MEFYYYLNLKKIKKMQIIAKKLKSIPNYCSKTNSFTKINIALYASS